MSFSDYYRKGLAVGVQDIKSDCIIFFHSGAEYSIPSSRIIQYPQLAKFNGSHYIAKLKDVKKALKE